jgi:hypothetical protein
MEHGVVLNAKHWLISENRGSLFDSGYGCFLH